MILRVVRKYFSDKNTVGDLLVDGQYYCHTLEDTVRAPGVKVAKETAIPAGVYDLRMDWSERFKRQMPHILDVPMFTGIRIHAGNTEADTEGCLLVGFDHNIKNGLHSIGRSTLAFAGLFSRITSVPAGEKITIEIVNEHERIATDRTEAAGIDSAKAD